MGSRLRTPATGTFPDFVQSANHSWIQAECEIRNTDNKNFTYADKAKLQAVHRKLIIKEGGVPKDCHE